MKNHLSLTLNPSFAIFSNYEQFVHLECRIGQIDNFIEESIIEHIKYFDKIKKAYNLNGYMQLRRLFFNDKSGDFVCVVDYLRDSSIENTIEILFEKEVQIVEFKYTYIDFQMIDCSFSSDHFDKNHSDYYQNERVIPYLSTFDEYLFSRIQSQINKLK